MDLGMRAGAPMGGGAERGETAKGDGFVLGGVDDKGAGGGSGVTVGNMGKGLGVGGGKGATTDW